MVANLEKHLNEIVERNLRVIVDDRGSRIWVKLYESMGGNASFWGGYPCISANFYYDNATGEIKFFENLGPNRFNFKKSTTYVDEPKEALFRVAVDIDFDFLSPQKIIDGAVDVHSPSLGAERIVGLYCNRDISDVAKSNLEGTAIVYNERHGFKLKEELSEAPSELKTFFLN